MQAQLERLYDSAAEYKDEVEKLRGYINSLPEGSPTRAEFQDELDVKKDNWARAEYEARLLRKEIEQVDDAPDPNDDWYKRPEAELEDEPER